MIWVFLFVVKYFVVRYFEQLLVAISPYNYLRLISIYGVAIINNIKDTMMGLNTCCIEIESKRMKC